MWTKSAFYLFIFHSYQAVLGGPQAVLSLQDSPRQTISKIVKIHDRQFKIVLAFYSPLMRVGRRVRRRLRKEAGNTGKREMMARRRGEGIEVGKRRAGEEHHCYFSKNKLTHLSLFESDFLVFETVSLQSEPVLDRACQRCLQEGTPSPLSPPGS